MDAITEARIDTKANREQQCIGASTGNRRASSRSAHSVLAEDDLLTSRLMSLFPDVFDYLEMFYNAKRRHGFNNQLSPVEFEKRYAMSLQGV